MRPTISSRVAMLARLLAAALALAGGALLRSSDAHAQAIAATVNGEPITSIDLDDRERYLRVVRKPATRDAALEDLVADHLKLHETNRYGIDASDQEMAIAAQRIGQRLKLNTNELLNAWHRAGVPDDHLKFRLRSEAAWIKFVAARNKTLGVSQTDVTTELGKRGDKRSSTRFSVRQIILVVPSGSSPAFAEARAREAAGLRNRFQDCESGVALARGLKDVAVKDLISRTAEGLPASLRDLLAKTPKGHLTPPQRSSNGYEMIAVCDSTESSDDTGLRQQIEDQLLADRMDKAGEGMYQELRSHAVIEKR